MPRATSSTSRTWSSTRSCLSPSCRQTRRRSFRHTISNSDIAQTRGTDSRHNIHPAHPSSRNLTRTHRTLSCCRPTSRMSSSSLSDMSAIFSANASIHFITHILCLTRYASAAVAIPRIEKANVADRSPTYRATHRSTPISTRSTRAGSNGASKTASPDLSRMSQDARSPSSNAPRATITTRSTLPAPSAEPSTSRRTTTLGSPRLVGAVPMQSRNRSYDMVSVRVGQDSKVAHWICINKLRPSLRVLLARRMQSSCLWVLQPIRVRSPPWLGRGVWSFQTNSTMPQSVSASVSVGLLYGRSSIMT
jgi:hypothetical protein